MAAQMYIPAHVTGGTPAAPAPVAQPPAPTPTPPAPAPAATILATTPVTPPAPATPETPVPVLALVPGTPTYEPPAPTEEPVAELLTPPITIMTGQPAPPPPTTITTTITGEPVPPKPAPEAPKAPGVDWKGIAMKQGAEIALTSTGIPANVAALIMPKLLANKAITFDEKGNVTIDTVAVNAATATLRSAYGSSISTETKSKMNPQNKPVENGPKNWRETLRSAFS